MGLLDRFEWDPESVPNLKLGLHIAQIFFALVAFILEIVVFRDDTSIINGNNGWPFGVCFLSVPAWIFLTMAPRFPRTRRLADPHAMTTVDAVFTIFWLSAFAAQAAYNAKGQCGGACGPSKGFVGMAFFVTLFFGLTLWLSIYSLQYYNWNGRLPGYDKLRVRGHGGGSADDIDPDKAAFSMAPHDEEAAYGPVHGDDMDNNRRDEASTGLTGGNPYGGAGSVVASGGAGDMGGLGGPSSSMPNPYGPDDYDRFGRQDNEDDGRGRTQGVRQDNVYDDDYLGGQQGAVAAGGGPVQMPAAGNGRRYSPPTARDDYDDDRPARFPAGNYS